MTACSFAVASWLTFPVNSSLAPSLALAYALFYSFDSVSSTISLHSLFTDFCDNSRRYWYKIYAVFYYSFCTATTYLSPFAIILRSINIQKAFLATHKLLLHLGDPKVLPAPSFDIA